VAKKRSSIVRQSGRVKVTVRNRSQQAEAGVLAEPPKKADRASSIARKQGKVSTRSPAKSSVQREGADKTTTTASVSSNSTGNPASFDDELIADMSSLLSSSVAESVSRTRAGLEDLRYVEVTKVKGGSFRALPQPLVDWLYLALSDVQEAMETLEMSWCAVWGTALGAHRDQGLIPWDTLIVFSINLFEQSSGILLAKMLSPSFDSFCLQANRKPKDTDVDLAIISQRGLPFDFAPLRQLIESKGHVCYQTRPFFLKVHAKQPLIHSETQHCNISTLIFLSSSRKIFCCVVNIIYILRA